MAKARNFRELEAKMSPESRARVAARVKETLENMSLDQLRALPWTAGLAVGAGQHPCSVIEHLQGEAFGAERSALRCGWRRHGHVQVQTFRIRQFTQHRAVVTGTIHRQSLHVVA